jgi:hypothetical protein
LNAALRQAQQACCDEVSDQFPVAAPETFDGQVSAMFEREWRLQRRSGQLRTIAIVDDEPSQQYLYPEFVLAQALLEKAGYGVLICDPSEIGFDGETATAKGKAIDLVYNRLVDFAFLEPQHAAIRAAYERGAVVVTPNPHIHALYANKRNLVTLSEPRILETMGVQPEDIEILRAVPRTRMVTASNSDDLWRERKTLFFKPTSGHGGKAVYRGDKITKSAWSDVTAGGYVAQDMIRPGERAIKHGSVTSAHKMDVRLYTYAGELLIAAARIYQGQTTNFRTPGGGFSPLYAV